MRRRLRSRPGTARARPGLGKGVADDTDSERAPMTVKASLGPSARENGLWSSPCGADTHRHWSSRLKLVRAARRDSEREPRARRGLLAPHLPGPSQSCPCHLLRPVCPVLRSKSLKSSPSHETRKGSLSVQSCGRISLAIPRSSLQQFQLIKSNIRRLHPGDGRAGATAAHTH